MMQVLDMWMKGWVDFVGFILKGNRKWHNEADKKWLETVEP